MALRHPIDVSPERNHGQSQPYAYPVRTPSCLFRFVANRLQFPLRLSLTINTAMKKLRVGVLFGGRSGEHEVSLLSAASVLNAIDRKKFEVLPIGITKEGRWVTSTAAERLLSGDPAANPRALRAGDPDSTEAAAVLARGEGVIVPPMPANRQTGHRSTGPLRYRWC